MPTPKATEPIPRFAMSALHGEHVASTVRSPFGLKRKDVTFVRAVVFA